MDDELRCRIVMPHPTAHDQRLYQNDAVVHDIANRLAKVMLEYGVPVVAAAFRLALLLAARQPAGYKRTHPTQEGLRNEVKAEHWRVRRVFTMLAQEGG